jgi:P4 family phage/plasmid primase-like protien
MTELSPAVDFITKVYGPGTVDPVFITSLPNEDAKSFEPGEKSVMTRDLEVVARHITKWDRPSRAVYFCVGTLKPDARPDAARPGSSPRNKENVSESTFLHADTDFKSIIETPDEIKAKLLALPLPPSVIVHSGRGYHSYWLLSEPTGAFADVEILLKQLADVVAGDQQVTHCAALMRLPGTHNTKEGGWRPVEIVHADYGRTYELADLEDMLSFLSPVLTRRDVPRAKPSAESNPFLAIAAKLGFKPPIDVEQRLSEMNYQGAGDSAIHATQLSVSASLLARGVELDEVVDTLIGATHAAAGASGANWNWPREERAIRRMCEDWLRKNPKPIAVREAPKGREMTRSTRDDAIQEEIAPRAVGGGSVVSLDDARAKKAKPKANKAPADAVPVIVADGVIETMREEGCDILLSEGETWIYRDGLWASMSPADEQWIRTLIQKGCDALGKAGDTRSANAAWKRLAEHPDLHRKDVPWNNGSVIATPNGMLDVRTLEFRPHAPEFYARRKIGAPFDPAATCPRFDSFVRRLFADRSEDELPAYVAAVQEFAGASLAVNLLSREERKALLLVGPSRTGKTEFSRVIRSLVGSPVATPSVSEISERFGLSSLYDAAAWIRDDAINEGDNLDPQRFKTIVTGEPIDIERKHLAAVRGVELSIAVLLTTNSLPRARDKSDAIFNRSIVLEMTNVVTEADAHELRASYGVPRGSTLGVHLFASESAGILNWALTGLARLLKRGGYDLPDSVKASVQRFKDDNNPVGEWARSSVRKGPYKVSRPDILCAYHGWQREQDGDEARALGGRALFPRLRAACPWMGETTDDNGRRYFTGIGLSDEGLQLWDRHNQDQLRGGSKGSSLSKPEVNRPDAKSPDLGEHGERF